MATYLLCGKYSSRGLQEMSVQRTDKAVDLIKQFGGEVQAMYATLGEHDLMFIVSLPGIDEALKTSVALTKLTGITFVTVPAVSVEAFDKLMGEI
jgi:uncharacterized protein with GYD domain